MFRGLSSSSLRPPVPPSSFPSGLHPTGGTRTSSGGERNGVEANTKRRSRIEMKLDEQGLEMKEDFDSLGEATVSSSSSPSSSSSSSSTLSPPSSSQPHSTVPMSTPTSTQIKTPPTCRQPPASVSTSASSSSNELFYDAEDPEYQTRRRSMYRSQGTASSPDLATLVRKAKLRGSILPSQPTSKDRRQDTAPPLPAGPHAPSDSAPRSRQRSSTSSTGYSALQSPAMPKGKLSRPPRSAGPSGGSDWVLTSPSRDYGTAKNSKSSVRQRTSAFLGRMLGQNTTRERSKTDASSPSRRVMQSPPPVPPLPADHASPVAPLASETFPTSPRLNPVRAASDNSKPLPPLHSQASNDDNGVSMSNPPLLVEYERPPPPPPPPQSRSPEKTLRARDDMAPLRAMCHGKRRSMSVGEVDLKKPTHSTLAVVPPPSSALAKRSEDSMGWDSTIRGILSDFKGELSQLDQDSIVTNTLDLRVPSAPQRPIRPRMQSAEPSTSTATQPDTGRAATSPLPTLKPNPTIVAHAPDTDGVSVGPEPMELPGANASLRSTSLSTGGASRASHSQRSFPGAGIRPLGPRNASNTLIEQRDRLQAHHRPKAFNSEPSLVPANANTVSPPRSALSQQDLTAGPSQQLHRLPSDGLRPSDPEQVEDRGKENAKRAWEEDEEFLAKEKIAEWLGGVGRVNKVALRHYIDNFDFSGLRLDHAFRRLCAKLFLKAETQQVDRILEEFSRRYWDCNPGSLFGNPSVVHAVAYSLLLLNTDLHVAELTTRMSRAQFVRNTLFTIQMQLQPNRSVQGSSSDLMQSERDADSLRGPGSEGSDVGAGTVRSQAKRSDSIASWNSISRDAALANLFVTSPAAANSASLPNDSTASVPASTASVSEAKTPSTLVSSIVYDRNWESDMESLLKDMYNAIKSQQVLQPLSSRTSTSSLTPTGLMRNRSLRAPQDRLTTLKRGSIRGIQSILAPNGVSPYSSNGGLDGRASPAPSFATSTNENVLGSMMSFLTPALGFASNLSHTIIRETQEDDDRSDRSERSEDSADTTISITDAELALLGPPWAKEGRLCRKQYNESAGKRAKSKAWLDVFVVIQKGQLNMFTFGEHTIGGQRVVGGGNWLENANHVGTLQLAHSLAHALPPPGYNRQRPHCMVLTLSSGAVYFFQAGTEELVNEWVQTCNYWAARQSKEPLAGGVSNMEYGWNRVSDVLHGRSQSDDESVRMRDYTDNASVRSGRSNHSRFSRKDGVSTVRIGGSSWLDRTNVSEWKPPLAPSVSSTHDEEAQLEALKKHVAALTQELQEHNELRGPMMALYPSRSQGAARALSNWEKKSQYLLAEHVKYESYVDSLQAAMALRFKKRGEKALEHALRSDIAQGSSKGKHKERSHPKTTATSGESSPGIVESSPARYGRHRRELAQAGANDESDA